MIIATVGSSLYKVLFLGHMLSFLIAFAPAVINPVLVARVRGQGDMPMLGKLAGHLLKNSQQIHFPALLALGGFGILMVLEGDLGFDHAWVSLSFLVWLAIAGIISGVMLPAQRRLAGGDPTAASVVERAGQLVSALVLVMLYLMIWKPGA